MEFLSQREFSRRMAARTRARVAELVALGTPAKAARNQAVVENGIYDRFVFDERGRVHVVGLDLPPVPARAKTRRG